MMALRRRAVLAAVALGVAGCAVRGPLDRVGDAPAAETTYDSTWSVDLDGDRTPDAVAIHAVLEAGPAATPQLRWYQVRLEVRSGRDGAILFEDAWACETTSLEVELARQGVPDPAAWFAGFFLRPGPEANAFGVLDPGEQVIQPDTLVASLQVQGVAVADPTAITTELRRQMPIRALVYHGQGPEDLRIAAYVPSLRRAVLIQHGYPTRPGRGSGPDLRCRT